MPIKHGLATFVHSIVVMLTNPLDTNVLKITFFVL